MTKYYKAQGNAKELNEIICKRLKALKKATEESYDIDITMHFHSENSIDIDRENSADDPILAEYYINTSKESIKNSLIEAKILNKSGELTKKVFNY